MQLVQGVREGKKVKQKIVASLGVIKSSEDLERLRKLADHLIKRLNKEGLVIDRVNIKDLVHKKTIYDGFGTVIDQLMQLTGFSMIIHQAQRKNQFDVEEIAKLILAQRLDLPSSKLRTYERQQDHGFQGIELQHVYRTMDAIAPLEGAIQKAAFDCACKANYGAADCFFFDVTTLYFESVVQDEVRDFGFSKDQKYHTVQIVLALVVDSQGMPLAYEVFKGNLAETKTLIPVLDKLRERFSIDNVTVVCDRGLASKQNVEALQDGKFHFVIATKLRSISKKLRINDLSKYSALPGQEGILEQERVLFCTMEHPQYKETLLIATYSPSRAHKDQTDRERLLDKLRRKIQNSSSESSIKNVISNGGYKKYTSLKQGSSIEINEKAIQEDSEWDGFHGIAVSHSAKLSVEHALERYKDLWRVEEAFRVAKCTLKTRPIFHWAPHRIRAHVLLCFITLFFERFLELRLRQHGTPLTPERIRYALSGVHSIIFEELSLNSKTKMCSSLSNDAVSIFNALGLSLERTTVIDPACCV